MQTADPKRKKCLEVTGGRLSYQASHEMPGLTMDIYSRKADHCMEGGGEVHFISSCASGRITRMMLADICGSEDTFKRLSCEMRNGLIKNINSIWQTRVVDQVSKKFREYASQGGCGTASVATYFAPTRSFVMCNIGNPPPLVYRAKQRTWEVAHGEVVDSKSNVTESDVDGVYAEDEYRHVSTKLNVDDMFVLYGNGFAQSAFPGGGVVGHQRLVNALQDAPHSPPASRLSHLVGLVHQHNQPTADSTIIVCRVTKTPVRLLDNLLAPLRLFKRAEDSTAVT